MNMLVTWIVDNPQASQEEDARARREQVSQTERNHLKLCVSSSCYTVFQEEQSREDERQKRLEEQKRKMEADQNVAATQFLSLFGEVRCSVYSVCFLVMFNCCFVASSLDDR